MSMLKIPCLGRPFNLGMLYDCRTEKLVPGIALWDAEKLKSATTTAGQPSSNFEIVLDDSIQSKARSLDIDANLQLSLMSGLVDVHGAAKYLLDTKPSSDQCWVSLHCRFKTRFEQLQMELIDNIQYPEVLDTQVATHVVSGITYGADAVFVFDRTISQHENLKEVERKMKGIIAKSISMASGSTLVGNNLAETNKIHCKYYGDLILPMNPSTFDEAIKVFKDMPQLITDGKCIPQVVYLYPLAQLKGGGNFIRFVPKSLVMQIQEIIEYNQQAQIRVNDFFKHDVCNKFDNIYSQLANLKRLLALFKEDFVGHLSNLVPKIRSGEAEEEKLMELVYLFQMSPFHASEMEKFLKRKENELRLLHQYIVEFTKLPKIQFDFPDTSCDLATLTADGRFKYVVCFEYNVSSKGSAFLNRLENYLRIKETQPEDDHLEWYDIADVREKLRAKANKFQDFVKNYCSEDDNIAFVVTSSSATNTTQESTIVLYIDGKGVPFELEKGDVRVTPDGNRWYGISQTPPLKIVELPSPSPSSPLPPKDLEGHDKLSPSQSDKANPGDDQSQSEVASVEPDEDEEEFIRKINSAFKCGEEIARRLAHAMLIGPPGSGKSSLMYRLIHKRRKANTSTNVAEGIATIEVRLDQNPSKFYAAVVIDGQWKEFKFDDSLLSHMPPSSNQVFTLPGEPPSESLGISSVATTNEMLQTPFQPLLKQQKERKKESPMPEPAATITIPKVTNEGSSLNSDSKKAEIIPNQSGSLILSLPQSLLSSLRKKYTSYKQFKKDLERGFSLYMRDTGGQFEFQEILPLLIFGPSIFLFVFRLDLEFRETFKVNYRLASSTCNEYTLSITIEEALLQCLATVDTMKRSDKDSMETCDPYVFIIGTHKDKLDRKLQKIKNGRTLKEEIRQLNLNMDALLNDNGFKDLVSYAGNDSEHVMFTVNNESDDKKDEKDFDLIRSRINHLIMSRKNFLFRYKINYLLFCLDLQSVEDNILHIEDFKKRAKNFGIETPKEQSELLHLLCNRIGIIQHFDKGDVKHIIINKPQFLYEVVSNLIIQTFRGMTLNSGERVELEKGILSFEAAESIIGNQSKITTKEVLDLLVHLRIIARFKDKFFMPCAINHLPEATDADLNPGESPVGPLCICFGRGHCPKGLFGVLVTHLMGHKKAPSCGVTLEFNQERISKDKVFFKVKSDKGVEDILILKVVACSYLEVSFIPVKRGYSEIANVCITIRKLFETYLSQSFSDLHYSEEIAKFEVCLWCENCSKKFHKVLSTNNTNNICCNMKLEPLHHKGRFWFCDLYEDETSQASSQTEKVTTVPPEFIEFDERMNPEQLSAYLSRNQMRSEDCAIIVERGIGGAVFLEATDEEWKEIGISIVGRVRIRGIKAKVQKQDPSVSNSSLSADSSWAKIEGAPNMVNLAFMKRGNKIVRLLSLISEDYTKVADALQLETHEQDRIEKLPPYIARTREVFKLWTKRGETLANGNYPLTWDGLWKLLEDSELTVYREQFFDVLNSVS